MVYEILKLKGVRLSGIGTNMGCYGGILLGTDSTHNCAISWLLQDTFRLSSEIVEIKEKPSIPIGEIGHDAFGNIPEFDDNGIRKRAIVAIGRQDVSVSGIIPLDDSIRLLGARSDHMILDISDSENVYHVGDQIYFRPNYQGLLRLCTSRYVKHIYK